VVVVEEGLQLLLRCLQQLLLHPFFQQLACLEVLRTGLLRIWRC
jgi:hypothetical protein